MTTVTREDVFVAAMSLPRDEQLKLIQNITSHLANEARHSFRPGSSVKFKTRNGIEIHGKVLRVNNKSVKVESMSDRTGNNNYGNHPVIWTVSPQLLTPA